jgi:hypothetical protein
MSKKETKKVGKGGLAVGVRKERRSVAKPSADTEPAAIPQPDWDYWSSLHRAKVHLVEVVALSCDIHPGVVENPGGFDYPNLDKFDKRLRAARRAARARGNFRATRSQGDPEVYLGEFAEWAVNIGARSRLWKALPPEFRQLVPDNPIATDVSKPAAAKKLQEVPHPESNTVDVSKMPAAEPPRLSLPAVPCQPLSDDDELEGMKRTSVLKIIAGLTTKRDLDVKGIIPISRIVSLVEGVGYKISENTVRKYVGEAHRLPKDLPSKDHKD